MFLRAASTAIPPAYQLIENMHDMPDDQGFFHQRPLARSSRFPITEPDCQQASAGADANV